MALPPASQVAQVAQVARRQVFGSRRRPTAPSLLKHACTGANWPEPTTWVGLPGPPPPLAQRLLYTVVMQIVCA